MHEKWQGAECRRQSARSCACTCLEHVLEFETPLQTLFCCQVPCHITTSRHPSAHVNAPPRTHWGFDLPPHRSAQSQRSSSPPPPSVHAIHPRRPPTPVLPPVSIAPSTPPSHEISMCGTAPPKTQGSNALSSAFLAPRSAAERTWYAALILPSARILMHSAG